MAARGPRTVRTGPALVFVGIVALVGLGGFALAAVASRPGSTATPASTRHLRGIALGAESASGVLRAIEQGSEPPADIAGALVVPVGTRRTGKSCPVNVSLYDCAVRLTIAAPPAQVATFFGAELRHDGWTMLAVDATAANGTALYARKGSGDGFYWEVGVRVEPAIPSITPALSGSGQSAPTSAVLLRVLELNDVD